MKKEDTSYATDASRRKTEFERSSEIRSWLWNRASIKISKFTWSKVHTMEPGSINCTKCCNDTAIEYANWNTRTYAACTSRIHFLPNPIPTHLLTFPSCEHWSAVRVRLQHQSAIREQGDKKRSCLFVYWGFTVRRRQRTLCAHNKLTLQTRHMHHNP